jgi:hypothetical protein
VSYFKENVSLIILSFLYYHVSFFRLREGQVTWGKSCCSGAFVPYQFQIFHEWFVSWMKTIFILPPFQIFHEWQKWQYVGKKSSSNRGYFSISVLFLGWNNLLVSSKKQYGYGKLSPINQLKILLRKILLSNVHATHPKEARTPSNTNSIFLFFYHSKIIFFI